jgi:CRISPR type III-A-associated protein Csm2
MSNQNQNKGGNYTPPSPPRLETRVSDILNMDALSITLIDTLLDDIKSYAELFGKRLNTSQLRNIFSKVLSADTPLSLKLLRPKIIYVAARQQNGEAKRVVEFFESLIQKVDTNEKVKNYQSFMEAFVAYHKHSNPK